MATWSIGAVQINGATDIGAVQSAVEEAPSSTTGMMTTNTGYWGALVTLFGLLLLGGFY